MQKGAFDDVYFPRRPLQKSSLENIEKCQFPFCIIIESKGFFSFVIYRDLRMVLSGRCEY